MCESVPGTQQGLASPPSSQGLDRTGAPPHRTSLQWMGDTLTKNKNSKLDQTISAYISFYRFPSGFFFSFFFILGGASGEANLWPPCDVATPLDTAHRRLSLSPHLRSTLTLVDPHAAPTTDFSVEHLNVPCEHSLGVFLRNCLSIVWDLLCGISLSGFFIYLCFSKAALFYSFLLSSNP